MKKFLVLCMVLLLAACKDDEAAPVDETTVEKLDSSKATEQLNWIFENNEDLHSPSDDEARIVDYNTGKPIGASIYYDNQGEFDNQKHRMNIKIDDFEGQFLLGWDAPNTHAFYLLDTTPVHSITEERSYVIDLSDVMYDTIYGPDEFKKGVYAQITAADIDNDKELEYIFYATVHNEETAWYDLVIEVYEYFPNQEQPFERVVQVKESTYSDQPVEITPAGEIIVDQYRGDKMLVALCEKNEWYVVDKYFVDNGEHSANYVTYDANDKLDYKNARRSEQNIQRAACKKKECEEDAIPPLTPKEAASTESTATPTSDLIEIIGDLAENTNSILELYSEQDLIQYVQDYIRLSMEAKNTGDYSIVAGYIAEGSPVYKDMIKSVPATYKKGIKIDHHGTDVEKIEVDVDYLYYTVVNTFEIFNSTYDGPVSFRSKYRVHVNGDIMQVEELLADELLN